MDETIIRGLITGAVLGAIYAIAVLIKKLIASPTETARRTRIVTGIALSGVVGLFLVEALGVVGTVLTAAVIGAVIWVAAGRNR